MNRWLAIIIIGAMVISGIQGCVFVVADENVAHDIRVERDRTRLARDIQKEIDTDSLLEYSDIAVSEDDGEVTLDGDVDSLAAMQRAIDIVLSRPGVEELNLRLEVELDG